MTSRRPYWCHKTMKWRPYWCSKRILWDFSSVLIQIFPIVLKLQYGFGLVSENTPLFHKTSTISGAHWLVESHLPQLRRRQFWAFILLKRWRAFFSGFHKVINSCERLRELETAMETLLAPLVLLTSAIVKKAVLLFFAILHYHFFTSFELKHVNEIVSKGWNLAVK